MTQKAFQDYYKTAAVSLFSKGALCVRGRVVAVQVPERLKQAIVKE